ncbi:MAG: HK97 family phage prohead protease [Planctomycetes bacterium]|nr:HK97 family phage prohead protease [Planctomycetota bacterium]
MKKEIRSIVTEVRINTEENEPQKIVGYSALFDNLSENLGGFVEKISPGAFRKALKTSDVRALFNHDSNIIVGRTGVNLSLKEDKTGLLMELSEVDTPNFRSVAADINSGLVTGQSFSFTVQADEWKRSEKHGEVRTITEIGELFDVGPVVYPAYSDTSAAIRSLDAYKQDLVTKASISATAYRRQEDLKRAKYFNSRGTLQWNNS